MKKTTPITKNELFSRILDFHVEQLWRSITQQQYQDALDEVNRPISKREVFESLKECNQHSEEGPDQVPILYLRTAINVVVPVLVLLFNGFWRCGFVPPILTVRRIVPVQKPN